jgi:hypothetical protein
MTLERRIAGLFRLDDEGWQRHANPWSGWTRLCALPLVVLALWSRLWLGWWSLVPIALSLLWVWINPRLFPPPNSTRTWMARAVLGERVWLNRDRVPVPQHHQTVPHVLSVTGGVGVALVIWGVVAPAVWPTAVGVLVVFGSKLWFMDRMVWLYADMKFATPEYATWDRE